jgi:hypothetical protein
VRRIPLSYRSHVTGFQGLPSGAIDYESALERDFVLLTLFDDASARIRSQPDTLNFEHEGRHRRYTPDYLIEGGGRFELIEIKYEADLQRLQTHLEPGFNIAREWAARSGGVFRVVTERAIRVPRLLNARRLLPLRGASVDMELARAVTTAARQIEAPTFGQIVEAINGDRARVLGTLWRLIARGELIVDLSEPIGLTTRVRSP